MLTIGPLEPSDREPWQQLFAGYNEFYGRTMPAGFYDQAWGRFRKGKEIHALGARLDNQLVGSRTSSLTRARQRPIPAIYKTFSPHPKPAARAPHAH